MVSRRPTSWLQVARLTAPPRPVHLRIHALMLMSFSPVTVLKMRVFGLCSVAAPEHTNHHPQHLQRLLRDDVGVVRVGRFKHQPFQGLAAS